MFALTLALATQAFAIAVPRSHEPPAGAPHVHSAATARTASDPTKALDAWLKLYNAGKIAFLSQDNISRNSLALKYGLAKGGLGTPTWENDLRIILEAVAKENDDDAAQALLEVAAVGLAPNKLDFDAMPHRVRAEGEKWAGRLTSSTAKEALAKAARGESKGDKMTVKALQIAGLRCLGQLGDVNYRPLIEQQLTDSDEVVRIHAADGLMAMGDEGAATALISSLRSETSDAVLIAVCRTLRHLYAKHIPGVANAAVAKTNEPKPTEPAPAETPPSEPKAGEGDASAVKEPAAAKPAAKEPPEFTRLAARAAIEALGHSSWRADMALLQVLDDWRSLEAIPALIAVLERFVDSPQDVQSGKLSLLLQFRTHELLSAMTGAVIPADETAGWRELWEREKDKIDVAAKHAPKTPATTVASGFCGIPVQGSRVLFILDLSGSMDFRMPDNQTRRLDFACRELERAMNSIAPNAHFNMVTFNGNPKAKMWNKDMVVASERNRGRFIKYIGGLRANGGTNLWSGFEAGLNLRSLVLGDRYETNVDEVFILSDGAPSVGDIIDPIEILRLVRETNRFANMRINTIFITSTNPEEQQPMPWMSISPTELMRRLAVENGGKFVSL